MTATQSLTTPSGCRWCGLEQRDHSQRWTDGVGWHRWAEPTSDQRKERMRARRASATPTETSEGDPR